MASLFRLLSFAAIFLCSISISCSQLNESIDQQAKDTIEKVRVSAPLIVAHRGASQYAPENTIPALKLAWKQGADAIEADFHLTKDKQIVCIHDKDTRKVSGKKLIVAESTLTELKQVDVGSHRGQKFKGTKIPTFAEVAATIPKEKKFYIEIKSTEEIIPYLLKEIKKTNLTEDQITFISFDKKILLNLKSQVPQYKTLWLSSFKYTVTGKLTPSLDTVLRHLKIMKADGFSSSKKRINQAFINGITTAGYEHHVWTVNDKATAKRFQRWGTKSITTDIPGEIRLGLIE